VRVVRDHRSVNSMHSATLEGPERFTQAAAAAQVTAAMFAENTCWHSDAGAARFSSSACGGCCG
jgi:hypothetical protein